MDTSSQSDSTSSPEPAPHPVKGKVVNLIFCGIAFILLLVYLFVAGEGKGMGEAFLTIDVRFLALTVVLMGIYWLLEALTLQLAIDKLEPQDSSATNDAGHAAKCFPFFKTIQVVLIGQYFNCITPFASGGQPIQAYYFQRMGFPLSKAMTVLLSRFIVYQFTLVVYTAAVLFARFNYFTVDLAPLMMLAIVGFVISAVVIVFLLMLALLPAPTIRCIHAFTRLLARMRLIKQEGKAHATIDIQLNEMYVNMRLLLHKPALLCTISLITALQLTIYFSISFAIYKGFGLSGMDFFTIISCQAFVYMISSFVPLPGAMGAAEGSYIAYFSAIYPSGALVAISTFVWRALTFYLPIIVGMVITLVVNRKEQ